MTEHTLTLAVTRDGRLLAPNSPVALRGNQGFGFAMVDGQLTGGVSARLAEIFAIRFGNDGNVTRIEATKFGETGPTTVDVGSVFLAGRTFAKRQPIVGGGRDSADAPVLSTAFQPHRAVLANLAAV